ncbi:CHAT domain-containing protein [Phytohabitans rumicis]|uniref:CHAT domain-containing protein n=1 Tax=Phytohabitans rumicis TaxID=1076125 RepID=A0A6V8LJ54_9ACTN|nr:CHAT domain-containing protein [Phytohabitans rumicis]GFJ96244.1 hypothetical protein Prum_098860 [Phytohabitans rumicis]
MTAVAPEDPVSAPVRRVLARDDLLSLAQDAEAAVGIVQERDAPARPLGAGAAQRAALERVIGGEQDLFGYALRRQLTLAESSQEWAVRNHAYRHAAVIVRFCRLVGITPTVDGVPVPDEETERLYERAAAELVDPADRRWDAPLDRSLGLGVMTTYETVRDRRLRGDLDGAQDLATRPDDYFLAGAVERYRAMYEYELGVCLIRKGQPAQVRQALIESDELHWTQDRVANLDTRDRVHFVLGLAAWADGERGPGGPDAALGRLVQAREHLVAGVGLPPRRTRSQEEQRDVRLLSVTLALGEYLAARDEPQAAAVVALADEALAIADRIRGRWRVIARSQGPLAIAFRRLYGDIALLTSRLAGRAAAELGLRVTLSAKQTGFASRMRTGRTLIVNDRVRTVLDEIITAEEELADPRTSGASTRVAEEELADRRQELRNAFSAMLADTVLPTPADLPRLLERVGRRYAVDYAALPDTLTPPRAGSAALNWFRTLITPDGDVTFERFEPGGAFEAYFDDAPGRRPWVNRLADATPGDGPDWRGLAGELLPAALTGQLLARTDDDPAELLICAHSALSLLPWPALRLDAGTRLIDRAVVAQTPVLTCLSDAYPPAVTGPALVRLVGADENADAGLKAIDIHDECAAWGIRPGGRVPPHHCTVAPDPNPAPVALGRGLAEALADPAAGWGFVHVAAHGGGLDLSQHVRLPERLSAGHALALPWPGSVLMASCHIGRLVNPEDAEPLSFVMAVLTGGGRCVVAAIDTVWDRPTAGLAADLVVQVRAGGVRLDVALRRAQRTMLWRSEYAWALLAAYVR